YAIGAGTKGKAPFIVDSLFGKQVVYDDVQIDDASLTKVAEQTGGAYFRAQDAQSLEDIYQKIDALEKTEITQPVYLEYNDDFDFYLLPALGLLLLEIVLLGTRLRKIP
ncbi:MAG: aerotolerance regulator BatA, partial [Myxococcota bacterium]|nr:aerotolerance regulator BatA [Myxococcota bacterium]